MRDKHLQKGKPLLPEMAEARSEVELARFDTVISISEHELMEQCFLEERAAVAFHAFERYFDNVPSP